MRVPAQREKKTLLKQKYYLFYLKKIQFFGYLQKSIFLVNEVFFNLKTNIYFLLYLLYFNLFYL